MNERIQALINQSWQTVEGPPREGMEDIRQALMEDLNPVFLEFAELIIRECMSVAKGMRNPSNLNYKPSDRFVDELRLHFGVEE
jgi:hypothetical protein